MQPTMNDWQRLDELLERGLDFYGRQLVSEAIQCWREVLYLSPGHQLALEYLEAAGASPDEDYQPTPVKKRTSAAMTAPSAPEPAAEEPPLTLESLSVLAVELIRERRLEDALALLYTAHGEAPKDQSISRSINVIKQRLTREYRAEIGDLGQIPHLTVDEALIDELDLTEDEREVLRLIDGIVALDDVVQTSGFALLQIYRVLAQLLRRNLIVLKTAVAIAEPAKATRVEDGPRTKTAPFRPQLVPPAPPIPTTPVTTGPKLVALPPLPEPPPESMKPAAKEPPAATATAPSPPVTPSVPPVPPLPPTPIGFSPAATTPPSPAPAAPMAKEPTASTAAPSAPAPSGNSTSTAMPIPVVPANTAPVVAPLPASALSFNVGPLAAAATAVSVKTAAAASAAANAASSAPNAPLDVPGSGAATADSPPRRPSPYAAHVAEAVRAHLQGKHTRAKELLALCVAECPDEPAARRNLQRLKERLGVKE